MHLREKFDIIVKPMEYRKAEKCEVADTHIAVVKTRKSDVREFTRSLYIS